MNIFDKTSQSPVIITGMHRSGTSMLTRFLEKLGLFVGTKKPFHNESIFFYKINKWILEQCNARWDAPEPFDYILNRDEIKNEFIKFIKLNLNSWSSIKYWGIKKLLNLYISRNKIEWGWKDPRNTITLPLWLEIFPNARIIYIKRHGVDVARSLRERSKDSFRKNKDKYKWNSFLRKIFLKRRKVVHSLKVLNLHTGLKLWDFYLNKFNKYKSNISNNIFETTFEEIISDPEGILKNVCEFCDLSYQERTIKKLCGEVKFSRKNAWRKNEELVELAKDNENILRRHGYNAE